MNPRHSSESNEHYTPRDIVEAARELLGGIDLDPASSAIANHVVCAEHWYGLDHHDEARRDGLSAPWSHNMECISGDVLPVSSAVFLNPPGGIVEVNGKRTSSQKAWWRKLMFEVAANRVHSALFVAFNVEILQTSQVNRPAGNWPIPAMPLDFPICFPERRIAYRKADGSTGKSPPHSSCIIYVPPKRDICGRVGLGHLRRSFGKFGACK